MTANQTTTLHAAISAAESLAEILNECDDEQTGAKALGVKLRSALTNAEYIAAAIRSLPDTANR